MIAVLAISALVLLFAWALAGLLLRVGGALLALVGLGGVAAFGDAWGLLVAAIGVGLWLAGHWHHALRHQEFKSPLVRQVFCRWAPAWLDPTHGWAVPVEERRRGRNGVDEKGRRG